MIPLFMQWFDGQELLAMEDGEQKTLTAKLYNMLLTFVANGRNYAFFMVKGAVGMTGTSMIPVTVEFNGANTLYVKAVLTCDNDPEKPMISTWSLAVGNVATRADAVIGQSGMTVDTDLSATSTNPVQNKVVTAALDGKAESNHTHGAATTGAAGFMSAADKQKLNNLQEPVFVSQQALYSSAGMGSQLYQRIKTSAHPLVYFYEGEEFENPTLHPAGVSFGTDGVLKVTVLDTYGNCNRLIYAEFNTSGKRTKQEVLAFSFSGDGTKFLNDAGQYAALPQQERGTMVFFCNELGQSMPGKGLAAERAELKPSGIDPVANKDILVHVQAGIIALITSMDATNVYCSYDTGTMLNTLQ